MSDSYADDVNADGGLYWGRQQANLASGVRAGQVGQTSRRIRAKGEEDRQALQFVLSALNSDISIEALQRALATIQTHLGGDS